MCNTKCVTHFVYLKMSIINPFSLSAYHGPDYFCDREVETEKLVSNITNGVHTTLISIRRMGKTILIQHVFNNLQKKKNTHCLYVDIYATQTQQELINRLSTAILQAFPPQRSIGKKILDFIKGLKPVISYDNLTGQPEVTFDWQNPRQREQSLESIFKFLDSLDETIVVALDEFQQVGTYPESNTEALLRSLIQPSKNIRFIFCGSSRHLLSQMFTSSKLPFFGSSQLMELHPISEAVYSSFIRKHFIDNSRKIDNEAIEFVIKWTRRHTWFTQVLCNRLFAEEQKHITLAVVYDTCDRLLREQETIYFQYRNLVTNTQWQTLQAVAKEEKLYRPGAREFLQKYKLGTPSGVKRSMDALLQKEMIYEERDEAGLYYCVYDCFLSRWLERL